MMKNIKVLDGVPIAAYEYVSLKSPSKFAGNIVFSHATGFHGRVFNSTISKLQDRYKCISFDHRAHGQSGRNETVSLDWNSLGDDIMCVAAETIPQEKILGVGHSMGAAALVISALKYPHLYQGLILYEPVIFPLEWRLAMKVLLQFTDAPLAKLCKRRRNSFQSIEVAIENFASKQPMRSFDRTVLEDYVKYGLHQTNDGSFKLCCDPEFEAEMYNTAHTHDTWSHLSELSDTMPIRILSGRKESYQISAITARMTKAINSSASGGSSSLRKCELVEWYDTGHFGPFEHPERFANFIKEFSDIIQT